MKEKKNRRKEKQYKRNKKGTKKLKKITLKYAFKTEPKRKKWSSKYH